jgi:hypothetical protein
LTPEGQFVEVNFNCRVTTLDVVVPAATAIAVIIGLATLVGPFSNNFFHYLGSKVAVGY